MNPIRTCSNCQFWERDEVDLASGACTCPLPISLSGFFIRQKNTLDDQGADCPAHRKRIERSKRSATVTPISSAATKTE
jgi:hypothetical protein